MPDPVLGPVAVGDFFRATFVQRLYDQRVLNMLWYMCTEAGTTPPERWDVMSGLANKLTDTVSVLTDMKALQSSDLKYETIRVNTYRNLIDRFPYFDFAIPDTGDRIASANLSNIALSIEKRALGQPSKPRTGIGRMQIGGVPADTYTQGHFLDTYLADANALISDIPNDITVDVDTVLSPVLVNVTDGAFRGHLIFGANAKRTVRDMRRRTVGVGE